MAPPPRLRPRLPAVCGCRPCLPATSNSTSTPERRSPALGRGWNPPSSGHRDVRPARASLPGSGAGPQRSWYRQARITSTLDSTHHISRCSSSMRRDQHPERFSRKGSGLPMPAKGSLRQASMSWWMRRSCRESRPADQLPASIGTA